MRSLDKDPAYLPLKFCSFLQLNNSFWSSRFWSNSSKLSRTWLPKMLPCIWSISMLYNFKKSMTQYGKREECTYQNSNIRQKQNTLFSLHFSHCLIARLLYTSVPQLWYEDSYSIMCFLLKGHHYISSIWCIMTTAHIFLEIRACLKFFYNLLASGKSI